MLVLPRRPRVLVVPLVTASQTARWWHVARALYWTVPCLGHLLLLLLGCRACSYSWLALSLSPRAYLVVRNGFVA